MAINKTEDGKGFLFITPFSSLEELKNNFKLCDITHSDDIIGFSTFNVSSAISEDTGFYSIEDIEKSFGIIEAVANTEIGLEALELLLNAAYQFGRSQAKKETE